MKTIFKMLLLGVFVYFVSCSKEETTPPAPQITANFSSDVTTLEEGNIVEFTDESTGEITSWNWTFEGGDPSTSTEQNPTVKYTSEGEYNVSLTVKNADAENVKTATNYITVVPREVPDEFDITGTWERVESNNSSLTQKKSK